MLGALQEPTFKGSRCQSRPRGSASAPSRRCTPRTSRRARPSTAALQQESTSPTSARLPHGSSLPVRHVPQLPCRGRGTRPPASCRGQAVPWRGLGVAPASSQAAPHTQRSERVGKSSEGACRGALPAPPSPPRRRAHLPLAAGIAALAALAQRLAVRCVLRVDVGCDASSLSAHRPVSAASQHRQRTGPRPVWSAWERQPTAARPCQGTRPHHASS